MKESKEYGNCDMICWDCDFSDHCWYFEFLLEESEESEEI